MPIRERHGKWHYRFWLNGHEYSGNTDLDATERNRTAANRKEAKARELAQAGRGDELRLQVTPFSKAADMYLDWCKGEYREHPNSAKRIATSFASLRKFFAKEPVSGITAGGIEDYKAWRRTAHEVREVTLRHDLHALSGFFQYAMRHNWCVQNPVEKVEMPSDKEAVRIKVLTPAEEARYFEAARKFPALYDLGRIMILQGARPDEVMRAKVADLVGEQWTIRSGKSAAAKRVLVLTAEAQGIMQARAMAAGPSGWLFAGKTKGTRLSKLNGSHGKVLEKLNPEGATAELRFVLYDLRHTFATRMASAGVPVTTLAKILGHSSLRMVMKYVHPTEGDVKAAMRLFEGTLVKQEEKTGRLM